MSGRVRYAGPGGAAGLAARHRRRTRPRAGQHHRAGVGAGGVLAAGATRRGRARCRAARHHGVGLLAWAPLGRGVLTGKYADGTPADSRAASAALAPYVEARRNERSARIVQAVLTAADGLGTSPLAVALAWVRDRPGVASAVVGARDAAQLTASMATEGVTLPAEIRAALDDVSTPAADLALDPRVRLG